MSDFLLILARASSAVTLTVGDWLWILMAAILFGIGWPLWNSSSRQAQGIGLIVVVVLVLIVWATVGGPIVN